MEGFGEEPSSTSNPAFYSSAFGAPPSGVPTSPVASVDFLIEAQRMNTDQTPSVSATQMLQSLQIGARNNSPKQAWSNGNHHNNPPPGGPHEFRDFPPGAEGYQQDQGFQEGPVARNFTTDELQKQAIHELQMQLALGGKNDFGNQLRQPRSRGRFDSSRGDFGGAMGPGRGHANGFNGLRDVPGGGTSGGSPQANVSRVDGMILTGRVQTFNIQSGYGFIEVDDGGENCFVHQSEIQVEGFRCLSESTLVEFVFFIRAGKPTATKVTGINGTPLPFFKSRLDATQDAHLHRLASPTHPRFQRIDMGNRNDRGAGRLALETSRGPAAYDNMIVPEQQRSPYKDAFFASSAAMRPVNPSQTILLVSSSESQSATFTRLHGKDTITLNEAIGWGLLNAPLSTSGKEDVVRNRDVFWKKVKAVAAGRPVRIFCSPLKRAMETCLLTLASRDARQLMESDALRVYPFPALTESGSSAENIGIVQQAIQSDPTFAMWQTTGLIDWSHFHYGEPPEPWWWSEDFRNNFEHRSSLIEAFLKTQRENNDQGECIVMFSHPNFIRSYTAMSELAMFGKGSQFNTGMPKSIGRHEVLYRTGDSQWQYLR